MCVPTDFKKRPALNYLSANWSALNCFLLHLGSNKLRTPVALDYNGFEKI